MSIYCSNLPNDQDMIEALGSLAVPLPIDIGDACFSGVGYDSESILISVERKKVGDIVQCITTGRYLSQAQKAKALGADVLVLVWEGRCRANPVDGLLEVPVWGINPRTLHRAEIWQPVRPTMTFSRFDQYLTELDWLAGVIVKHSDNVQQTAAIIKAIWDNFQQSPDKHNSLHSIYHQPNQGSVLLMRPSLVRRVASEMPGVGWEWSREVAERFGSVREMVLACEQDWSDIEHENKGKKRRLGKVTAQKIVRAIGGE